MQETDRNFALLNPELEGKSEEATAESGRVVLDELYSAAFEELVRLASLVKRHHGNRALSTGTLINAAWLQLAGSGRFAPESEQHFRHLAAQVMRQIVVEGARRRSAVKRGGGKVVALGTHDAGIMPIYSDTEIITLDAALKKLNLVDRRKARIVEESFFGGFEDAEIASHHGISLSTVSRELRAAKAWLAIQLRPKDSASAPLSQHG